MMPEEGTTREAILQALQSLLASAAAADFFPPAAIDEPNPERWYDVEPDPEAPGAPALKHACAVQDGPPPAHLAFVRGAADAPDELELEAAVAYAVQAVPGAGHSAADLRAARRARRDAGAKRFAALVAADPTLGISPEVYAEVLPVDRQDDVPFPNAPPAATVIAPVRVLYPGANPAD